MTVQIHRDGPVGWLVFDRPDAGNAIDAQMFVDLERAWTELDADDDVSVIVNTGNGRSRPTFSEPATNAGKSAVWLACPTVPGDMPRVQQQSLDSR